MRSNFQITKQKILIRHTICLTILFLWLISFVSSPTYAQPKIPRDYTQKVVEALIKDVDKSDNDALLKMFFASHQKYSFNKETAVELLESALKGEKRGTKRWFLLQKNRAFGSMKSGKQSVQKAIEIYGGIFDQANQLKDVPKRTYLRNIVYDYISYIPTPYLSGQKIGVAPGMNSLDEVLGKALSTYFLLGSPSGIWEPDWREAINYTSWDVWPYITVVQNALKDSTIPKNSNFYQVSILVLKVSNTAQRIEGEKLIEDLQKRSDALK